MPERLNVDICVIGGGSAGLSVAAGASQLGVTVALVEKGRMGGDCLNYGCVPSKALLAAGRARHAIDTSGRFGIQAGPAQVDMQQVHDHVHGVIAGIAPHDSVERFEGLGVRVVQAAARFLNARELQAGDLVIGARRFVIATGSSPLVPPIPGLDHVPYLTNESIFDLNRPIPHLLVVGGGPIGLEMAQAHARLGARVTVLEMARAMPKDDPELAAIVLKRLRGEGIEIHENTRVTGVEAGPDGPVVKAENEAGEQRFQGSDLLLAVGRRANVDDLNLDAAGVAYGNRGIEVDARLRTSNRRIYAIGDVAGGLQFTHVAGYHAGIVIRNALFRLPARTDDRAIPWVTYTDPELAHVGMTEAQAREAAGAINVLRWPFTENDRARAERDVDGFVKVVTDGKGRILGASIVGTHAGELIQPWILAIANKMKIGKLAGIVAPYPTLGEVNKRAASSYFVPKLFSERTKKLVRLLTKLG